MTTFHIFQSFFHSGSPTPSLTRQRSVSRKYSLHAPTAPAKASQYSRIPRMPTQNETELVV